MLSHARFPVSGFQKVLVDSHQLPSSTFWRLGRLQQLVHGLLCELLKLSTCKSNYVRVSRAYGVQSLGGWGLVFSGGGLVCIRALNSGNKPEIDQGPFMI